MANSKRKGNKFLYVEQAIDPTDDHDEDYKPILQGIINTRCNYDGAKIEGNMEF